MDGKDVVINGREGYDVTFESPWEGVQSERIVAFTVDDRYYVIKATALPDLFDEYANVFDNIINSFVIEYPAPISSPSSSPTVTPSPTPSPSPIPGFEAIFAIAGLFIGGGISSEKEEMKQRVVGSGIQRYLNIQNLR
jgi:hypothetical protein